MTLPFTRRRSAVLSGSGLALLALSACLAAGAYPFRPPAGGDRMGLALFVVFPLAIGGGLLLALVCWRERLRTRESVRWLVVFPVGAVLGVSVPATYLLASPSFAGGVRVWYELGTAVGGICGVVAEVASWDRDGG